MVVHGHSMSYTDGPFTPGQPIPTLSDFKNGIGQ